MMMKNTKYSQWVDNDGDDEEHESTHDGLVMMMMMKNMKYS